MEQIFSFAALKNSGAELWAQELFLSYLVLRNNCILYFFMKTSPVIFKKKLNAIHSDSINVPDFCVPFLKCAFSGLARCREGSKRIISPLIKSFTEFLALSSIIVVPHALFCKKECRCFILVTLIPLRFRGLIEGFVACNFNQEFEIHFFLYWPSFRKHFQVE